MDQGMYITKPKVCPICEQKFYLHCRPDEYAYRLKIVNYRHVKSYVCCSYTCYIKAKKKYLKGDE